MLIYLYKKSEFEILINCEKSQYRKFVNQLDTTFLFSSLDLK